MRAFIILCLVAVACADISGYNYKSVEHSSSGSYLVPGGASGSLVVEPPPSPAGGSRYLVPGVSSGYNYKPVEHTSSGNYLVSGGTRSSLVVEPPPRPAGGSRYLVPNVSVDPPTTYVTSTAGVAAPAEFEKEFFTFTAPEGEFNDGNAAERAASSLKQGLRVIFIKGPENSALENAALALAKQAAEQKTAIYVLNKQADLGDLANKLNAINKNNNNKPEVHFVKYRTPEDAANAQKAIQGQYDLLGGKSQNVNGGVANVINFASKVTVPTGPAPNTPRIAYLPSALFRFRA
ncbi:uncharacterized protein [Musca autumnalis]|uniref:uncharacterized protein n=1 Tax=Musca autumnalis TaxID=221902 RepID=UPI003CE969C5